MIAPDSLQNLRMLKYHTTPGDVPRDDLAAYVDVGEYHEFGEQQEQGPEANVEAEVEAGRGP